MICFATMLTHENKELIYDCCLKFEEFQRYLDDYIIQIQLDCPLSVQDQPSFTIYAYDTLFEDCDDEYYDLSMIKKGHVDRSDINGFIDHLYDAIVHRGKVVMSLDLSNIDFNKEHAATLLKEYLTILDVIDAEYDTWCKQHTMTDNQIERYLSLIKAKCDGGCTECEYSDEDTCLWHSFDNFEKRYIQENYTIKLVKNS